MGPVKGYSSSLEDLVSPSSRFGTDEPTSFLMATEAEARRDAAKAIMRAASESRKPPAGMAKRPDVETTGNVKTSKRQNVGNRQSAAPFADVPEEMELLSKAEWAKKVHPNLRSIAQKTQAGWVGPPGLKASLDKQYGDYVAMQKAVAEFRIDARKTNVAGRTANMAADPLSPGNIPATPGGQAGYAALTGQPEDVQKKIMGVVDAVHGTAADPVKAVKAQAIQEVLQGITDGPALRALNAVEGAGKAGGKTEQVSSGLREELAGRENMGMLLPGTVAQLNPASQPDAGGWFRSAGAKAQSAGPQQARTWVESYRRLQGFAAGGSDTDKKTIAEVLLGNLPSAVDATAAVQAGLITEDERSLIESHRR